MRKINEPALLPNDCSTDARNTLSLWAYSLNNFWFSRQFSYPTKLINGDYKMYIGPCDIHAVSLVVYTDVLHVACCRYRYGVYICDSTPIIIHHNTKYQIHFHSWKHSSREHVTYIQTGLNNNTNTCMTITELERNMCSSVSKNKDRS